MKRFVVLVAVLILPLVTNAKIRIGSLASFAESSDGDARSLIKILKGLGAQSFPLAMGNSEEISLKGTMTITNGAACDNGHETYEVSLSNVDQHDSEIKKIVLDGSAVCDAKSDAEKFFKLMQKWGGKTVEPDCGLGHCWQKIDMIQCMHFDKLGNLPASDICDVEISLNP